MFLKHRNIIALILLLTAAVTWTLGQRSLKGAENAVAVETTAPGVYDATMDPVHDTSMQMTYPVTEYPQDTLTGVYRNTEPTTIATAQKQVRNSRLQGILLCVLAAVCGAVACFGFALKAPLLGPDGAMLLLAFVGLFQRDLLGSYNTVDIWLYGVLVFLVLLAVRDLWGWMLSRFSLFWCAVQRLAKRSSTPQLSLLIMAGWTVVAALLLTGVALFEGPDGYLFTCVCAAFSGALCLCCLWRYGKDLAHFQRQLDNYRNGLPITVGNGEFSRTEAKLLDIQEQHEEAVRTAVTSERFKVELISNVSHDLRTPLTAILGYSELLQKETLSADGQEQLQRLQQKAGYMSELVESLFELTKVSSGVVESEKEEIDLIRLLEQTIGLFDDQLAQAGLFVRRNYFSDSVRVETDGARMHQVFANLLGNAIKYAMAGTRIYLEVKETEISILVRMMNTSSYEMDFKPEEIMQRFARGDKARSTKGSGLGLAIAQTYTESVGGIFRIGVDGDQFSAIVELPKTERNL